MLEEERCLIKAGQDGDVESFNQLVHLYQGRVYTVCYRVLGDGDMAADAAQDAFISAFRNLHTFRGGSFRAWLLRIATNTCYDVLRARKRRPTISLDAALTPDPTSNTARTFPEPYDQGESPDDAALRHELGETIQQSLALLPDDQRIAIILSDIQGMNYQEIADATGASLGTVKSRLSRGRARLRDILKTKELLPSRYRHHSE
jgi:RNA polymerase sigma-70 factor (ECF subfamily)